MPEIVVDQVQKTLGGLLTLQGINLEAETGSVTGIIGPSGCGKSTLFNIVSGIMTPDQGRVVIGGRDVTGKTGRVSYMRQKDLLLPSRSLIENVSIPLILKGMRAARARVRAAEHFDVFGLRGFEDYYPAQLSGGMRQRAAMLRTYLFSSDVLLLDEPLASLDAITRHNMHVWMLDFFAAYRPTVLFITHDLDEALSLCDKVYVLSACPTVVRLEEKIGFRRPPGGRTITDPAYVAMRDRLLENLTAGHLRGGECIPPGAPAARIPD